MHPAPVMTPAHDHEVADWVDRLLAQARALGASDLHVDPQADGALLRLRIHGMLSDWQHVPPAWQPRLVARIKVMAHMDMAERRLPQDGRLHDTRLGDIRVASLPVLHGEKLCLRLSPPTPASGLEALQLPAQARRLLEHAIAGPDGLILITGPTGSGKTTTLYACLQALNGRDRHIATVEDPVERIIDGISQSATQPRIGLDFASMLRALLRQDPDILMVGEIRDRETADMAMQAAETGHLVLSTLHTGSALEALTRLRHLGLADYLIAANLRLVLAQRLLRRLCRHCRGGGNGCPACIDGHDGRIGIYEALPVSAGLGSAWMAGADEHQLRHLLRDTGWQPLRACATQAVREGMTSAAEVLRVLGPEMPEQPA